MNSLNEVLCVNEHDEVEIKPADKVLSDDRICMKLLDLSDPTNPRPLKVGRGKHCDHYNLFIIVMYILFLCYALTRFLASNR